MSKNLMQGAKNVLIYMLCLSSFISSKGI